jgi:hypothetical protein
MSNYLYTNTKQFAIDASGIYGISSFGKFFIQKTATSDQERLAYYLR